MQEKSTGNLKIPGAIFTNSQKVPKHPPLQGEGWGGDGFYVVSTSSYPIPLLTSPLKGEVKDYFCEHVNIEGSCFPGKKAPG